MTAQLNLHIRDGGIFTKDAVIMFCAADESGFLLTRLFLRRQRSVLYYSTETPEDIHLFTNYEISVCNVFTLCS